MIRKRGNSYGVLVYDGARRRKVWVGSAPTRKAARELEREAETRFARHSKPRTVGQYARSWLDSHHGEGTRRPEWTTRRQNEQSLGVFLEDFALRRLDEVQPVEAREWARAHRHQAKAVAAMFNDALRDGVCYRNPFARLGFAQSKGRSRIQPLTEDEVDRLGELALARWRGYGPMCRGWILCAAWIGWRPGEAFAARWSDVDPQAGWVRIERQIRADGEHLPKTKKTRTVVLPPQAREALLGMGTTRQGLLFTTASGRQLSTRSSYRYYWDPVRAAFAEGLSAERRAQLLPGGTNLDLYALRHVCASILADRGCDAQTIAHQLGNSPRICQSTYIHTYEDRAAERLRTAFGANVRRFEPRDVSEDAG